MEIALWVIAELAGWVFSDLLWAGPETFTTKSTAAVSLRGPCAYCRKRGGPFVTCRACRTPHHRDCARVNGRCAVYGCANRKFLVPAA